VALTAAVVQNPLPQFYVLGILAQLHLWAGHLVEAETLISQGKQDPNNLAALPVYALTIPLADLKLALRQGDYQRAATDSNVLLAQLRQSGVRSQIPKVLYLQGQACLGLGQVETARERLSQARAEAETIGSRRMLWQILFALSRLETDPTQANRLRQQGQELVETIAGNISDPDLRASFLDLATIDKILIKP
jgi:hypothetical protein